MAQDTNRAPDGGIVDLVRVLVLVQGGIALLSTVEILFWATFADPAGALGPSVLLTGGMAVGTLALATALGQRFRPARRLVLVLETVVLASALVDLGLALAFAHRPLGLVPLLTRLVLPVAVIVLLRRPTARTAFRRERAPSAPAGATS
jgi:hypothetical protein